MRCRRAFLMFCSFLLLCSLWMGPARADEIVERAGKLHFSSIVLDIHDHIRKILEATCCA